MVLLSGHPAKYQPQTIACTVYDMFIYYFFCIVNELQQSITVHQPAVYLLPGLHSPLIFARAVSSLRIALLCSTYFGLIEAQPIRDQLSLLQFALRSHEQCPVHQSEKIQLAVSYLRLFCQLLVTSFRKQQQIGRTAPLVFLRINFPHFVISKVSNEYVVLLQCDRSWQLTIRISWQSTRGHPVCRFRRGKYLRQATSATQGLVTWRLTCVTERSITNLFVNHSDYSPSTM